MSLLTALHSDLGVQIKPYQTKNTFMDIKTIYLLTDFSEHARNASKYALDAFGTTVKYYLINTFSIHKTAATLINIEEMAFDESKNSLEIELAALRAYRPHEKLDVELICREGDTANAINELLKKKPAELIVVGSKGHSKIDDFLIGSVTTSIMRGVKKPVLSVPIKAKFTHFDQIVLADDLGESTQETVGSLMEMFKNKFASKITGATVRLDNRPLNTEEHKALERFEQLDFLDGVSVLENESVSKALMDYCHLNHSDLLVVVAKHSSFFKRFFHKSITKELVNHEVLPILVLEDR